MKVLVRKIDDEENWTSSLSIEINGEEKFSVHDGEPEDNSLGRNFSSCYGIPSLLKAAYEAGKAGEDFIVEETNEEE